VIQCPICHVLNEDRSLFCAECGQRFAQQAAPQSPGPQAAAPSPPPENINPTPPPEPPKRPAVKLHSPILGGGGGEPEEPNPGRNRFANSRFGGGSTGSNPVAGPNPNARNRGPDRQDFGDDEADDTNPKSKPRKGLHSPLLDFGDDEPEQFPGPIKAQSKSQIMFPHRSRPGATTGPNAQVPQEPDAEPRSPKPPGKGGLRSPLLGGDDVDQHDDEDDFSNPNQPRKRLRSPVLDGGNPRSNNRFMPEPPAEIREESNVLRSPLLAAKVPLPEKPVPGAMTPPKPPEPSSNKNQANMNQPPVQQGGWPQAPQRPDAAGWNSPTPVDMQAPPQPQPQLQNAPPAPPVVPPGQPAFDQPSFNQQPSFDQPAFNQPSFDQPTFNQPTFNQPSFNQEMPPVPAPINPAPLVNQGFASAPSPVDIMPRESAWDPPSAGTPASREVPPPVFTPEPAPTPKPSSSPLSSIASGSSSLRSRSIGATESGAKIDSEPVSEPPVLRSKRSSSRLPSALNSEPQPDMLPSKAKHMAFAKFMLFPFFAAAAFKVWYLVAMGPTALSSAPFLGDQVSQLVVIICLIIFTFMATSDS
jgi:hypothetical protein